GQGIDRVSVTRALSAHKELEIIGGMAAMVELDQGLPALPSTLDWCARIKELSSRRKLMFAAQAVIKQCQDETVNLETIVSSVNNSVRSIQGKDDKGGEGKGAAEIATSFPGGLSAFLDPTLRPPGIKTGFAELDEIMNGLHGGELTIIGARPSMGKTM